MFQNVKRFGREGRGSKWLLKNGLVKLMVIKYPESSCLKATNKASCIVVKVNGIERDVSILQFTELAFILTEVGKAWCGEKFAFVR